MWLCNIIIYAVPKWHGDAWGKKCWAIPWGFVQQVGPMNDRCLYILPAKDLCTHWCLCSLQAVQIPSGKANAGLRMAMVHQLLMPSHCPWSFFEIFWVNAKIREETELQHIAHVPHCRALCLLFITPTVVVTCNLWITAPVQWDLRRSRLVEPLMFNVNFMFDSFLLLMRTLSGARLQGLRKVYQILMRCLWLAHDGSFWPTAYGFLTPPWLIWYNVGKSATELLIMNSKRCCSNYIILWGACTKCHCKDIAKCGRAGTLRYPDMPQQRMQTPTDNYLKNTNWQPKWHVDFRT